MVAGKRLGITFRCHTLTDDVPFTSKGLDIFQMNSEVRYTCFVCLFIFVELTIQKLMHLDELPFELSLLCNFLGSRELGLSQKKRGHP